MKKRIFNVSLICVVMGLAQISRAVKVGDITRIDGQRTNVLTGLGLVIGLKGTGDGGDFQPAIAPLASVLKNFSDPSSVKQLSNVQNVALVQLIATVPSNGARSGDHLDVTVMSMGAATSLKGGVLFVSPMKGPIPTESKAGDLPFALSSGQILIEDPSTPTVGVVKGGCVMEADLPAKYIESGKFTLVIEDPSASWTNASNIAKIINDAESTTGETLAVAKDPKTVEVTIPLVERERPDSFISRVQRYPVPMLPTEARVQINDRTGTMIITGDVEISPVVISHKGLTISTITPAPVAPARNPLTKTTDMLALDTTGQGGAKLQELVDILDRLRVPAEDRITIVKELYKTGKLHAKLIVD
jgi:flagellar P-ring protein FlgI